MFAEGLGVTKDDAQGTNWFRKAAEQGDVDGQLNLGVSYADGQGVAKDEAEAVRWFRKAAEQGLAPGQFNLGLMYATGQGVTKDQAEAVRWYRKAAAQGHAAGQFNLGLMYDSGQGVAKDEAEAVRWYRNAAEQGLAAGQFILGVSYANGQGVAKDEAEAVRWFRKAAEQGDAAGQYNLGVMYAAGQGVRQDQAEAVRWYRKAAAQGHAAGQFDLGLMYDTGQGVTQDASEAVRWYRKAAEQGYAAGQNNLGLMYVEGRGVAMDADEAVRWFRKAAAQGQAHGQVNLGLMYADGRGVAKDEAEAVRWFRKAAAQGDADGQAALDRLTGNAPTPATPPPVPATTPAPPPVPAAPEGKVPLYFAAELAPTTNIPPEAPLCYKFIVAGPEEQLRKLKSKYPGLYDERISTNPVGGKNLVAKRKDETGKEITYFYSTSPGVCNDYQKGRIQTPAPQENRAGSNAPPQTGAVSASAGGASPNERYRFVGKDQDIVEDTRTKLQWQRCSLGQTWNGATCSGKATKYNWDEARRIAPAGWRLPTKDELASLVYCSSGEPAYWKSTSETCKGVYESPSIWIPAFPNTPEEWFWSSTPTVGTPYQVWYAHFGDGSIGSHANKDGAISVRFVRGRQ